MNTTRPNPVVSEIIERTRDQRTRADHESAEAHQHAAESTAITLTKALMEAGESNPSVTPLVLPCLGPIALANVAGYPLIMSADTRLVDSGHFRDAQELLPNALYLIRKDAPDLSYDYAEHISSIDKLSIAGDPSLYADPRDFRPVGEGERYAHSSLHGRAVRDWEAAQSYARDRDVEQEKLQRTLTPYQLDLAHKPMYGMVTVYEHLCLKFGDPHAAMDSIAAARPAT